MFLRPSNRRVVWIEWGRIRLLFYSTVVRREMIADFQERFDLIVRI